MISIITIEALEIVFFQPLSGRDRMFGNIAGGFIIIVIPTNRVLFNSAQVQ